MVFVNPSDEIATKRTRTEEVYQRCKSIRTEIWGMSRKIPETLRPTQTSGLVVIKHDHFQLSILATGPNRLIS